MEYDIGSSYAPALRSKLRIVLGYQINWSKIPKYSHKNTYISSALENPKTIDSILSIQNPSPQNFPIHNRTSFKKYIKVNRGDQTTTKKKKTFFFEVIKIRRGWRHCYSSLSRAIYHGQDFSHTGKRNAAFITKISPVGTKLQQKKKKNFEFSKDAILLVLFFPLLFSNILNKIIRNGLVNYSNQIFDSEHM